MKLVVLRGDTKGKAFPIEEGSNLIGRWDPDAGAFPEVDLEVEDVDAKISRKHAVINRTAKSAVLEDVGSLNGTYLNKGKKLTPGEKVELRSGDEIIIGKVFLKFEVEG